MKKCMNLLLTLFLALVLLMGCAADVKENQPDQMPDMKELAEFSDTHTKPEYEDELQRIKDVIDAASYEEICEVYEESLKKWEEEQTELKIDHMDIAFSRDELLMNEQANERLYNNFFVDVDIYLAEGEELLNNDDMDKLCSQVSEALSETPFGRFTMNTLTVSCHGSLAGIKGMTDQRTVSISIPDLKFQRVMADEEYEMQTQIYEYLQKFNQEIFSDARYGAFNVTLKCFGIEPETKSLYMEIPIYSAPFDMEEDVFKESLKARADELYRCVTGEDGFAEYLKEQGVTAVTIALYTPWDREAEKSYNIYKYEL